MQTTRMYCAHLLFDRDGVPAGSLPLIERNGRTRAAERPVGAGLPFAGLRGRRDIDVVRLVAPHLDAGSEEHGFAGLCPAPGAAALRAAVPPGR